MKTLTLQTTGKSQIVCGLGAFAQLAPTVQGVCFIVTDSNVSAIYGEQILTCFPQAEQYVLPAGEASKNYNQLKNILLAMAKAKLTRNATVVAIGGGVVGDIAGLAASLYMRGTKLVQVPTTLLAQVDSSVGGKTAVDMGKIKNAVGTFYQPELVIIDPAFLSTLPQRELACGMGEIVKYAALNATLYDKLIACEDVYNPQFISDIIFDCVTHKANVVQKDERDINGLRKSLNLGHTVGHCLELCYNDRSHGEYVAIGMYFATFIAERLGVCSSDYAKGLYALIKKVIPIIPPFKLLNNAAKLALHDKKNNQTNQVNLVLPTEKGCFTAMNLPYEKFVDFLKICNKTLHMNLAVVGKDVSRSDSPAMHTFIANQLGYAVTYDKLSLGDSTQLQEVFTQYDAFNVTIPYKQDVISYLQALKGDAPAFGAVNTVYNSYGYNTDGLGFMLMLENAGIDVWQKKVLIIGAGGAARSLTKKLMEKQCSVSIYDCDYNRSTSLSAEFGCLALSSLQPQPYDVIINASGVGMHKTIGISPVDEDMIAPCGVAVDLIYQPPKSKFLQLAEGLNKKIINGQAMLFYQAYYAECIYLGLQGNAKQAKKLFNRYLEKYV